MQTLRERVQEKNAAIRVLENDFETSQLNVDYLKTRLAELEVAERAKATTIQRLETEVAGERKRALAANDELEQLRTDNEALSARSAHLEQQREQLAQRCTSLQAEKEALDRKCKKLEEEVDRLLLVDAMNERLRTNIELLQRESDLKCATTKRESEEAIQATRRESEASIEAVRNETQATIQMLKVQADAQQDVVEKKARAWQRKWIKEKEANNTARAALNKSDLDDDDDLQS